MRLIDADKLIEEIRCRLCGYGIFTQFINEQPVIDTLERGEWVEDICCDEKIICNSCGNEAYVDSEEGVYVLFDYCPYCGAKMGGDKE